MVDLVFLCMNIIVMAENIEGDMECGGAHNLSLIGFGYFIVFCFLFYFFLFHDISPFVTYWHG